MKTFYENWNDNEPGYNSFGSFTQTLMELYRIADSGNRDILNNAYPEYFVTRRESDEEKVRRWNAENNVNQIDE